MKTYTQIIDVEVVFDTHKPAIEEAARRATGAFLKDSRIHEKHRSHDYYNDMLLVGTRHILEHDLMDKGKEDLSNILFRVFLYKINDYRRTEENRRRLMHEASVVVDWFNAAEKLESCGEVYQPEHPMKELISDFLAVAPPEVRRICKAFMEQEKKSVSRADACRQLGMSEYELKKKLRKIGEMLQIFSDF